MIKIKLNEDCWWTPLCPGVLCFPVSGEWWFPAPPPGSSCLLLDHPPRHPALQKLPICANRRFIPPLFLLGATWSCNLFFLMY